MNNNFNYGTFNNEKKWCKSHFLLYMVSFMFVMSAMLCINPDWLNKYYDTTLCATSTIPTIDSSYFDYKDNNFTDRLDGYVTSIGPNYNASNFIINYKLFDGRTGLNNLSNIQYHLYSFNGSAVSNPFNITTSGVISASGLMGSYSFSVSMSKISTFFGYGNTINNNSILVFGYPDSTLFVTLASDGLYSKFLAYREGVTAGAGTYEDGYNAGYSAGQTAGEQTGYQNGYNAGYTEGEGVGYNTGYTEGNNTGYTNGQNSVINHPSDYDLYTQEQYNNNYNTGYTNGQSSVINRPQDYDLYTQSEYDANYNLGYNVGIDTGYANGYDKGYFDGDIDGYNNGVSDGYTDGYNASMNGKSSFKDLMFAIVDAPFNVLSNAFDFEIFGINLSYFLIAIVSLLLVAFVIRKLL